MLDMYRFAYSFLMIAEDAENAVQDAFLRYYENPPSNENNLKGWLMSTVRNICLDQIKKKKREKEYFTSSIENESACHESQNNEIDVLECLDRIESKYSNVLRMHYYADMSIKEISKNLMISESAVKKRLERGRNQLREIMEKRK